MGCRERDKTGNDMVKGEVEKLIEKLEPGHTAREVMQAMVAPQVDEKDTEVSKQRKLTCPSCEDKIVTATMQLRIQNGPRDIHCPRCKFHGRAKGMACECGVLWHLNNTHRTDPHTHRSKRAPGKQKTNGEVGKAKNKSCRKAPGAVGRKKEEKLKAERSEYGPQDVYAL